MINFRDCYSEEEIVNSFKRIKQNNEKLLIWQSHTSPRLKCEVKVDHIVASTKNIVLKPLFPSDDLFDFVSTHGLFVKSKYKELLFKVNRRTWNEGVDQLTISIPDSVKVIEMRESNRKKADVNQFFTMKVIKKMLRGTKTIQSDFKMQILDISLGGACVLLSSANVSFFKVGDKFQVTDMEDMNIFDHLESEVAYITDSHISGYYKMGVQFKRKIDHAELNQISL
jgi:hypothetical protein